MEYDQGGPIPSKEYDQGGLILSMEYDQGGLPQPWSMTKEVYPTHGV